MEKETKKFWQTIFSADNILTTEKKKKINYLEIDTSNKTNKVTEDEGTEIDKDIDLEDINSVIEDL